MMHARGRLPVERRRSRWARRHSASKTRVDALMAAFAHLRNFLMMTTKKNASRETAMSFGTRIGLAGCAIAAALALTAAVPQAQEKKIKIGVVYDYSGPLAAGGSELHGLGTKIMIDYFNAHGGVAGYKIEPIYADAQSKPDVAINEAVRLIEQENVDILLGFFSSAQCVPIAARVD
jgi:ABC-type branched-subunit amino acid transport system substrate-binding protein